MTDLEDIQLPKDIHKIGQYAFSGCNNLRTINIPQDVISIGDCAFEGCYLKNVVVNDSEPALISSSVFPNRANMTLVIHEGNKETYLSANYWKDFKEIIDDSDIIHFADKTVERICISNWDSGERDYRSWDTNGDGLLSKEEAASVESTAEIVPQWAVLALESRFLETDITSFDEFKYFTGLTTIEGWTFSGCDKLSSITIPENVYYIEGDEGYSYISNQEASINTWKRKCGLGAFNSCSSLTSIYIPENVKGIGNNAFYGCNGLQKVHISNLKSWMDIGFGNWSANPLSYAHHLYLNGEEVKDLVVPNDVNTISDYTFNGCSGLTSVTFHDNVTSIGVHAFYACI